MPGSELAKEMRRVLRSPGSILLYDLRLDHPRNPALPGTKPPADAVGLTGEPWAGCMEYRGLSSATIAKCLHQPVLKLDIVIKGPYSDSLVSSVRPVVIDVVENS
jgi:hypothetical protein